MTEEFRNKLLARRESIRKWAAEKERVESILAEREAGLSAKREIWAKSEALWKETAAKAAPIEADCHRLLARAHLYEGISAEERDRILQLAKDRSSEVARMLEELKEQDRLLEMQIMAIPVPDRPATEDQVLLMACAALLLPLLEEAEKEVSA